MFPDYHFISGLGSYIQFTQKQNENYSDSQVDSQQELRICICCTLNINIINACFDYRYSTVVLQTEV